MIRVDGLTYYEVKLQAGLFNGQARGDKLTEEQRVFVGFGVHHGAQVEGSDVTSRPSSIWLQPVNPKNIDDRLDSLAELMDRAPNYLELARRILENEKSKSK